MNSISTTSVDNFAMVGSDLMKGGVGDWVGRSQSLEQTYKHRYKINTSLTSVKTARALQGDATNSEHELAGR